MNLFLAYIKNKTTRKKSEAIVWKWMAKAVAKSRYLTYMLLYKQQLLKRNCVNWNTGNRRFFFCIQMVINIIMCITQALFNTLVSPAVDQFFKSHLLCSFSLILSYIPFRSLCLCLSLSISPFNRLKTFKNTLTVNEYISEQYKST